MRTSVHFASVHGTTKINASFNHNGGTTWVDLEFARDDEHCVSITLFFDDEQVAKAYVAAIESVEVVEPKEEEEAFHPVV